MEDDSRGTALGLGCSLERFREVDEMDSWISDLESASEDEKKTEALLEKVTRVLNYYQEQPRMLDPHFPDWLERLLRTVLEPSGGDRHAHAASAVAQRIIKVRGRKVVQRYLPHDVAHVEPVLKLLERQDASGKLHWETKNVLLLWMSILALVPFHLSRFESGLADRLFNVCKTYSAAGSRTAAFLAAKFFTRPEVVADKFLAKFVDWIVDAVRGGGDEMTGALMAAAAVFKHGARHDLLPHASAVLELSTSLQTHEAVSVRKLGIKLVQRVGLTFLEARVAGWRYQRGSRSLALNLGGASKVRHVEDVDVDDQDVPEETEEVLEQLLTGLRNQETIVRWSAAKGVGRVTSRLPKELADDVVCSLLQLFSLRESDGAWHGGCLALAELCRRGLLLPSRLPEVVAVVDEASIYDERRGNFSVGSHVRDAACYVCWSLARAFAPDVLAPHLGRLATSMLTVAVFDREVNCRRAASAAFQENVGRQGAECLPSAIEILTTVADYHAVGSRIVCFTESSVRLAKIDSVRYGEHLVEHLLDKKIGHWDGGVRELAAKALGQLGNVTVLPRLLDAVETTKDLQLRHGAILSIGQVVLGLSGSGVALDDAIVGRIKVMVSGLEKRLALRGSGGEMIRLAVVDFIGDASVGKFPCHDDRDVIDLWKIVLDDNLANPSAHDKVAIAMSAFVKEYCKRTDFNVVDGYLGNLDASEEARRGSCVALSSLPKSFLVDRLVDVLPALSRCTRITAGQETWAEGRRDAVAAITKIVKTVSIQAGVVDRNPESYIDPLYECYLDAMDDYSTDRRGDVGAWVREAAMSGLFALTEAAEAVDKSSVEVMMRKLAQQAVEKIDRTRGLAAKTFVAILLLDKDGRLAVPRRRQIFGFFPDPIPDSFGWNVESVTFPIFAKLLRFDEYRDGVLLGLIVSVGGLTERLVVHAGASLYAQLKDAKAEELEEFCNALLRVFESNLDVERVSVPMLRFLERVLNSGHLAAILDRPHSSFALDLFALVKRKIAGCCEPNKLMLAADVLCALLRSRHEACKKKCLVQLSIFLCHRFPRIRKAVASKLFEALLVHPSVVQDDDRLDEINGVLGETQWDRANVETLRPIRNGLCDLMGIPPPAVVKKPV